MPAREFTITELVSEVLDPYAQDTGATAGVKFVWTAAAHTVPEGGWKWGLQQRVARDDPAGSDEPAEQVLGPNFQPFTLHGTWDDKWAGAGYADQTWQDFEKLVQRGNLCRFELESISVTGRITEAEFDYKRRSKIHYRFTVSPHRRLSGGDARRQVRLAPAPVQTPKAYFAQAQALADAVTAAHAEAPALALSGTVLSDVTAAVATVTDAAAGVGTAIDTRLRVVSSVDGAQRVVQAFQSLRIQAAALSLLARSYEPDVLAYEAGPTVMAFDVWTKGLGAAAAQLALSADGAAQDLSRLLGPRALALYQPHAGESLYAISLLYFSTPHRWREIADRNGLKRPILDGTELLVIPRSS